MTIVTSLPMKDAKDADKVPLVDGSVKSSSPSLSRPPPPPYEAVALEAGSSKKKKYGAYKVKSTVVVNGVDGTDSEPELDCNKYWWGVFKTCVYMCVFVAVYVFLKGPGCRAFTKYIEQDPEHWGNKYRMQYAAANKDMIKPVAGCGYDVYKSLSNSVFKEGAVLVSGADLNAAIPAAPDAAAATTAIPAAAAYPGIPEASAAITGTAGDDGYDGDDGKPQLLNVTKTARFIHDFSVNITGIVDVEAHCCFIMPLFHDAKEPVSLNEVMFKMTSNSYDLDMKKVIDTMRVVKPALNDLSTFGLYISKDCADYATYRLEKAVLTDV